MNAQSASMVSFAMGRAPSSPPGCQGAPGRPVKALYRKVEESARCADWARGSRVLDAPGFQLVPFCAVEKVKDVVPRSLSERADGKKPREVARVHSEDEARLFLPLAIGDPLREHQDAAGTPHAPHAAKGSQDLLIVGHVQDGAREADHGIQRLLKVSREVSIVHLTEGNIEAIGGQVLPGLVQHRR